MRASALILGCLVLAACATAPQYDATWTWDSPVFDEEAVLGQAGLLSAQKDTLYTSIWTLGGGAFQRRQEHHLREQHELWVRRQVELGKMTVEEARGRIRDYVPARDR
ncbi:MAG: hypothetical protein EPO02_00760 [Nitrospirae bacterium]|nr:MAG: hypothetical protein EPO02_00760 [Nitrospirota bacterium]